VPILLDTTVLIDYLRGAPSSERLDNLVREGETAITTAVNVEELVRGLRPREEKSARDLVEGLAVFPLGPEEGWRAGVWRRDFATRGITLSQADCLIASAALSLDAVLATGNPKHFPMSGVRIEHWPVGD
jgi:predicted nucleic acid-binding protein